MAIKHKQHITIEEALRLNQSSKAIFLKAIQAGRLKTFVFVGSAELHNINIYGDVDIIETIENTYLKVYADMAFDAYQSEEPLKRDYAVTNERFDDIAAAGKYYKILKPKQIKFEKLFVKRKDLSVLLNSKRKKNKKLIKIENPLRINGENIKLSDIQLLILQLMYDNYDTPISTDDIMTELKDNSKQALLENGNRKPMVSNVFRNPSPKRLVKRVSRGLHTLSDLFLKS